MLRTILGIIAGVATWSVLCIPGNMLAVELMRDRLREDLTTDDPTALAILLAVSIVYSLCSGYVAAWIAKAKPLLACTVAGVILLGIGIGVQATTWDRIPLWYHLTFLASLVPVTLLGGLLRRVLYHRPASALGVAPSRS
jgi:hypothetical protein